MAYTSKEEESEYLRQFEDLLEELNEEMEKSRPSLSQSEELVGGLLNKLYMVKKARGEGICEKMGGRMEIELDSRTFKKTSRDDLGGTFTLTEVGAEVEHSVSFGNLVVDFNEDDRIVGLEIYSNAKGIMEV